MCHICENDSQNVVKKNPCCHLCLIDHGNSFEHIPRMNVKYLTLHTYIHTCIFYYLHLYIRFCITYIYSIYICIYISVYIFMLDNYVLLQIVRQKYVCFPPQKLKLFTWLYNNYGYLTIITQLK